MFVFQDMYKANNISDQNGSTWFLELFSVLVHEVQRADLTEVVAFVRVYS